MTNNLVLFHGSDIEEISRVYKIDKDAITNYSSNVSPYGVPDIVREELRENISVISTYPDRKYTELREAIAKYTLCNASCIRVGNGATELISKVIAYTKPQKAVVIQPCYSEYIRAIQNSGGAVVEYFLREHRNYEVLTDRLCEMLDDDTDMLVICNPNNPTSTVIEKEQLSWIVKTCYEHNIVLMVDETYIEFIDDPHSLSAVGFCEDYDNVVVLRSTSKFFAAPGLRLGYMITANSDINYKFDDTSDPWSIGSLTELAGRVMFRDAEFIKDVRTKMSDERRRVCEKLKAIDGIRIIEPKANYVLVKILRPDITSDAVFEHCIKKGMMIRNCASFAHMGARYFRFCFLTPEENDRLLEKIKIIFGN